jgi:hypothetical protein
LYAKQIAQIAEPPITTVTKTRKETQEYRVPRLGGLITAKATRQVDVQYNENISLDYWLLDKRFYHQETFGGAYNDIFEEQYEYRLKRTGELVVWKSLDEYREYDNGRIEWRKNGVVSEHDFTHTDILLFDWQETRYEKQGNNLKSWGNNEIDRERALSYRRQGNGLRSLLDKLPVKPKTSMHASVPEGASYENAPNRYKEQTIASFRNKYRKKFPNRPIPTDDEIDRLYYEMLENKKR